jgi:hypothetical protein
MTQHTGGELSSQLQAEEAAEAAGDVHGGDGAGQADGEGGGGGGWAGGDADFAAHEAMVAEMEVVMAEAQVHEDGGAAVDLDDLNSLPCMVRVSQLVSAINDRFGDGIRSADDNRKACERTADELGLTVDLDDPTDPNFNRVVHAVSVPLPPDSWLAELLAPLSDEQMHVNCRLFVLKIVLNRYW